MAVDDVQVPPIRTNLNDPNLTGQTAKEWYLYWQKSGQRINTLNGMVTWGGSGDRLDPALAPDGALYIESDRGGIIYQNQGGEWHYLAGTMWGTLSPDQRPAGLGPNDAGFEFRSTDSNPDYAPRQFLWSGSAWIETTMVLYGGHATRPAADQKTPPRTIYVETDRGGVIYQQQANVWHYLAGTMWGTLSPDQRPTDLGVNDAGFDFRTTVAPPREFLWSGSAWVEITPVTGALNLTHPNVVTKVGSTAGQIVEGGITDLSAGNSGVLQITASGQVGIGTNPDRTLSVYGTCDFNTSGANNGTAPDIVFGPGSGEGIGSARTAAANQYGLDFYAGGGRRLSLTNTGNVGIGINTPTYLLQLSSDFAAKPGTSTWTVVSDLKLKQNVEPCKDDSLAILGKLDWIRFEYNGKADTPRGLKAIGLVAQALEEQLPEAVRSTKTRLNQTDTVETDVLAIDYHHIIVHSARAIQQLAAEIKQLKTKMQP